MKKKIHFTIVLVFSSCLIFASSFLKDTTKFKHLSIGFRTGKDLGAEFKDPVFAKFLISIDPIKNFRVDFQFGINKEKRDYIASGYNFSSGTYTTTMHPESKATSLAIGGFGMYNFEKTRLYLGYRFGKINYNNDVVYNVPNPSGDSPIIGVEKSIINMHSAIIGGEHFLSKWFSLGAEFGFNKGKETYTSYRPGSAALYRSDFYSDASLILRFYII